MFHATSAMPRAAILTYNGCYASSVTGFADILQIANAHLGQEQAPASALFDWHFVSPQGDPALVSNGLPVSLFPHAVKHILKPEYPPSIMPRIVSP